MIINPTLPSGHTIFCDDVRQETSGKQTYVGVYTAVMYVMGFPGTLPQIYCVITYREALDFVGEVKIRVIHEVSGEDTLIAEIGFQISEEKVFREDLQDPTKIREAKLVVPIIPFNIQGAGQLKVRAYRGDDEIRLGALRIVQNPEQDAQGKSGH